MGNKIKCPSIGYLKLALSIVCKIRTERDTYKAIRTGKHRRYKAVLSEYICMPLLDNFQLI